MTNGATELQCPTDVNIGNLPARLDRRMAAKVISQLYFPISHRTLESWPIRWRIVNGRALGETEEILAFAAKKLADAVSLRG